MVKAIFLKCSMYLYFFFHSIKKVEHKLGSILSTKKSPKVFDFKTNFDHKKTTYKMPKKTHTKQYQNHLSDSTHFVMKNLTADTSYLIKLSAQNELGMGKSDLYHSEVRTLKSDPTYVPDLGKKNMP